LGRIDKGNDDRRVVLSQDEVNPVMTALLDDGLEVTALLATEYT
jgi:hypothetical protein